MGQANSVSDLERAEHLGYADSKGVKRVSVFNDGIQINAATEAKQDPLAIYKITDIDDAGYYGYLKSDGVWYIMSGVAGEYRYIKGDSDYATNWNNRVSLSYNYFSEVF